MGFKVWPVSTISYFPLSFLPLSFVTRRVPSTSDEADIKWFIPSTCLSQTPSRRLTTDAVFRLYYLLHHYSRRTPVLIFEFRFFRLAELECSVSASLRLSLLPSSPNHCRSLFCTILATHWNRFQLVILLFHTVITLVVAWLNNLISLVSKQFLYSYTLRLPVSYSHEGNKINYKFS